MPPTTQPAPHVLLETTLGPLTLELYASHAPKTVHNFLTLVSRNYYTSCAIHRIIPGFMFQTGDPTGTGRGGSSIYPGGTFEDEIPRSPDGGLQLRHTGAGVLSMANSGPGTNGSHFFVTLAPTPWLDGKHTVFGRVSKGLRVVQRVGLVKTHEERPVEDVRILRASVVDEEDGV